MTYGLHNKRTDRGLRVPFLYCGGDRRHGADPGTAATETIGLFTALSAVVLGVTLYVLTRDAGRDLALFGLACRIVEAAPGDGSFFFAVASTAFAWLFLRGQMIPATLAWLGVIASALLVILIPLQQFGLFGGPMNWSSAATWIAWLPMLLYEVGLGLWLLIKGAKPPIQVIAGNRGD